MQTTEVVPQRSAPECGEPQREVVVIFGLFEATSEVVYRACDVIFRPDAIISLAEEGSLEFEECDVTIGAPGAESVRAEIEGVALERIAFRRCRVVIYNLILSSNEEGTSAGASEVIVGFDDCVVLGNGVSLSRVRAPILIRIRDTEMYCEGLVVSECCSDTCVLASFESGAMCTFVRPSFSRLKMYSDRRCLRLVVGRVALVGAVLSEGVIDADEGSCAVEIAVSCITDCAISLTKGTLSACQVSACFIQVERLILYGTPEVPELLVCSIIAVDSESALWTRRAADFAEKWIGNVIVVRCLEGRPNDGFHHNNGPSLRWAHLAGSLRRWNLVVAVVEGLHPRITDLSPYLAKPNIRFGRWHFVLPGLFSGL
ncbi:MAG: hypothetical protein WC712_09965 [Candidatus Brocadiia bacterium]